VSNVGTWMQTVALGWLVYELTHDELALGTVNFLAGIPVFFLALPAGALADRHNRKRLVLVSQYALVVQALLLGILFALGALGASSPHAFTWIAALSLFGGVASALAFPSWQAMVPDIVPRENLLNAMALNAAQFNTARLLGPLVAGAVLAVWNPGGVFFLNAASFVFVIGALVAIRPQQRVRPRRSDEPVSLRGIWRTLAAGVGYARQNRSVGMLLVSVVALTIFGMPMMTLLPAIADKVFSLGSQGFARLMAANGLGAVAGALVVATLPRGANRALIIRSGLLAMSLGLIAFSLTRNYTLGLALSTVIGGAFLACVSTINTSLQAQTPDELRGRVMALFVMGFMGIMPFSALAFGAIGRAIGPERAVLAGALGLLAYATLLWVRPGLLTTGSAPAETATQTAR